MDTGFETTGNAILTLYDEGRPILVTDPWFTPHAYFGSWGQSHEIPPLQMKGILGAEYVWVSHGHPDHLNADSMPQFMGRKVLLPDHVGKRIQDDLKGQGHEVHVMKDRQWYPLSKNIRVYCISDLNQDAVLLADVNGRLIFNRTDASDHGWENHVRSIIKRYPVSFMMGLSSRYGDADMINFFDEDGRRIAPVEVVPEIGKRNAHRTEAVGAKYFIPFSSMHTYQREDSAWANVHHTTLDDYWAGFKSDKCRMLPAYIRYDCGDDSWEEIKPREMPVVRLAPGQFGDDWNEKLDQDDRNLARDYFQRIQHLSSCLDYINLRVGGQDNVVRISERKYNRGVTFEAPRNSLMTAIRYEVFDDMLIANFMKTTLHGDWSTSRLYPDFTPYVAKYADNGMAKTREQLAVYFKSYRDRAFLDYLKWRFEKHAEGIYRKYVSDASILHKSAKKAYWFYKKTIR
jgi:hypothetical protein